MAWLRIDSETFIGDGTHRLGVRAHVHDRDLLVQRGQGRPDVQEIGQAIIDQIGMQPPVGYAWRVDDLDATHHPAERLTVVRAVLGAEPVPRRARGVPVFEALRADLQAIDERGAVDFDRLRRERYPDMRFRVDPLVEAQARMAEIEARYRTDVTMILPRVAPGMVLRIDPPSPDLLIRPDGSVDLFGQTPEQAARAWWRALLRSPKTFAHVQPDGALVVSDIYTHPLAVLFPDGTWDAQGEARPEGHSREFWSAVARLYATVPQWLMEGA
ncbi:MAG: hypothetical protein KF878_09770 [Planctomycetes bacterium]|nr:hypothetical protein [Planctomycetota bacterium]